LRPAAKPVTICRLLGTDADVGQQPALTAVWLPVNSTGGTKRRA
jgi:hypothetical protein